MRTPLAAKSALSTLGSKPVYCEDDEDDDEEMPLSKPQQQHEDEVEPAPKPSSTERPAEEVIESIAVPATPMPSNRQPASRRWIEPMDEEEEEEEEEGYAVDENGQPVDSHADGAGYEGNEHLFRPQFQPLTPITEATYEFTRYTNARTPGTATRSAIGPALKSWRPLEEEEEDEDDDDEDEQASRGAILTAGPIASRASQDHMDEAAPADDSQPSDERSFASTSGEEANRSAWAADNKASFELTKGHYCPLLRS